MRPLVGDPLHPPLILGQVRLSAPRTLGRLRRLLLRARRLCRVRVSTGDAVVILEAVIAVWLVNFTIELTTNVTLFLSELDAVIAYFLVFSREDSQFLAADALALVVFMGQFARWG